MFPNKHIIHLRKSLKNKKIAITGSTGFVAKNVIRILKDYNLTNKKIILLNKKNTDYSLKSLKKKLKNVNLIIHLSSATGGIGYTAKFPASQFYIALKKDINIFEASKDKKISRLVSLANLHVYSKKINGLLKKDQVFFDMPPEIFLGIGWVKRTLLVLSKLYRKQYNFDSKILISANTYGVGEDLHDIENSHIIPSTIYKLSKYKKISFFGGKSAVREFINVKDLSFIILLALITREKQSFITVGSGEKISIGKLIEKISKIMTFKGKVNFLNKIKDNTQRFCGSKDVEQILNYKPIYKLDIGLRETITWMKKRKNF
jgi:nucleoside-diphosphate-sugar epimerase